MFPAGSERETPVWCYAMVLSPGITLDAIITAAIASSGSFGLRSVESCLYFGEQQPPGLSSVE